MTAAHDTVPPLHGPYDDDTTADQAQRAADAVRYLNYATRDGLTEPTTAATVTGHLADAAYRLPQFLAQLSDWLYRELSAGGITSDHPQPPQQLAAAASDQLHYAAEQAARLAQALDQTHQLASTLHTARSESLR